MQRLCRRQNSYAVVITLHPLFFGLFVWLNKVASANTGAFPFRRLKLVNLFSINTPSLTPTVKSERQCLASRAQLRDSFSVTSHSAKLISNFQFIASKECRSQNEIKKTQKFLKNQL